MSMLLPFTPSQTVKVTTGASSARIAIPGSGKTIQIVNSAAFSCAVALGGATVTAAAATGSFASGTYHIPAVVGAVMWLYRDPDGMTNIAYINDSGAAVLYISVGDGGP
jgi:hypothetical protein